MEEKYFRFAVSDDSDTLWGYAVGGGELITSDSEDITLNAIKKVDVKTATTTLVNWLRQCDIEADYDYVARAVSRAFDKGQYDMEFDTWWEGYYEEYSKCTLEAADNPLTDWEEFEDDFSEDTSVETDWQSGNRPYAKVERLWRKATGKEPPAKLCVLSGQKRAISKDGKWIVVDGSRSDEELIEAIKNFA